jgi:hypothetical protein
VGRLIDQSRPEARVLEFFLEPSPRSTPINRITGIFEFVGDTAIDQAVNFNRHEFRCGEDNPESGFVSRVVECVHDDHSKTREKVGEFLRPQFPIFKIQNYVLEVDDIRHAPVGVGRTGRSKIAGLKR